MESRTKNKQTIEKILEMTINAFGSEYVSTDHFAVEELKEGYYNAAYRITLKEGKKAILKIAPPADAEIMSYERNIMRTEVEMMRLVKKHTKVPVPEVYYYDDSKDICGADYFFMEYMEGDTYSSIKESLSSEDRRKIEIHLGLYNKAMNQITGNYYGYPGQERLQGECWEEVFLKLSESVLCDGERKNVDLGIRYDEIRSLLAEHKEVLKNVIKPQFVHWDLWDGNLLIKDGQITGIMDFERALWGDPLMEYYFQWTTDNDGITAFMEGYGLTSFTKEDRMKRIQYNIYLYLIMTIECSYRKYENDRQYVWAKGRLKQMTGYLSH